MRIVSYNILDGGEGRADPIAEVLIAQRPDIVALIEADNAAVVARVASRLKMDSITAVGHRHSVAVLSHWPIIESVNHAMLREEFSNCFLEAAVRDPLGADWILGLTHLHPHAREADDFIRMREVSTILAVFGERRRENIPHILLGDFNADSPIQQIDPARCKPSTQKAWRDNGGHLPTGAVQSMLSAGYLDTLHELNGEQAARRGTFSTQYPEQRVDYIFAHGFENQLRSAWIEHDRLAQFASDHFPVGAEIQ